MENGVFCDNLENFTADEVPITTQEYNDILEIQSEILAMIASRVRSSAVLERLCQMAESLLPNSVASIMLVDSSTGLMSVLSAPSVPEVGHQALRDLKPGPTGGSCGNAVFRNEAQYVSNTFEDPRWEDLRQLAIDFNLCSCWSMPVRDESQTSIGSFALSSFEHRSPSAFHKKLLEIGSFIVNIVLKNQKNEQKIKMFSESMQSANEGIIITDSNNAIIEVNEAFERIYGYKEKDVIGKNPSILSAHKNSPQFYQSMWEEINTKSKWSNEIVNKTADGKEIAQWLSISKVEYDDSDQINYLAIFTDLSELKKTQKLLEETAFVDKLTQLPNKTQLEKMLNNDDEKSLIFLNVNNFSFINTAYGLDMGDKLLVKVSNILPQIVKNCTVFRINSDEFAILYQAHQEIESQVHAIKKYFQNNPILIDDVKFNVSFTYGASQGANALLRNAAAALKTSKQIGKNNLYIFDDRENKVKDREAFIQANNTLYDALANDMLVPYYQGIRDNETRRVNKYEVLARICHGGKVLSPAAFLEQAKLSGVLPDITKIMIQKSFQAMSQNEFSFSLNITEDDLRAEYLCALLEEQSKQHDIDPSRVTLEILEGISAYGKTSNLEQLQRLKSMGFLLAIDDFGSEYSNFERVLDLDIDFLKIDARYIKDIDTNEKSYEIVKSIAFFAKNVNIPCIAEYVHSESVQKIIDAFGIQYSQGFYFCEPQAKPMCES